MHSYRYSVIMILVCFLSCSTFSFGYEDVPVTVQKISDRVINLRVGDIAISGDVIVNNVTAIKTSKGIIVIDTGYYPQTAYRLRKIFEKEFGRKDFICVINTHWHWDHINGNQAFADVPIIAHEKIIPAISEWKSGLNEFIEQRKERIQHWTETFSKAKPETEEYITANGWRWAHARFLEEFEQGFEVVMPSVTFREKLQFNTNESHVVLLHVPFHSDHDLIVYVPDEKALIIGDIFFPGYLPRISAELVHELPDVIHQLKTLIRNGHVKTIIPGHKRLMDLDEFGGFVMYLDSIWNGVNERNNSGLDFDATLKQIELSKFDNLKNTLNGLETHKENIKIIWDHLNNK